MSALRAACLSVMVSVTYESQR